MRILSVSNFYDTHGGGLERVAGHLSREFLHAGHVASWAASDADGLPDSPAALVRLSCANPTEALTGLPMPLPGPRSVSRLRRAVRESDVVIIHDALYVPSILAMLFARSSRKTVVLIQHIGTIGFTQPLLRGLIRVANRLVTRPMMTAADRLVFISQTVRDEFADMRAANASLLVFNGVDRTVFNSAEGQPRSVVRKHWGLPEDGSLAVFVGRFVEKKGLSVLRALAANRPGVTFALLGKGPLDPAGWDLPNVRVLGQQSQEDIADLYRAGDMLVLPSVGEGYPLVIQEAMACGLPVICGDDSARADPDATQWLQGVPIDLSNPEASAGHCAAALDRLLENPPDRTAMARYAAETYDWRRMAETILAGLQPAGSSYSALPRHDAGNTRTGSVAPLGSGRPNRSASASLK
jgi:glycosyltransferase involved in cell wall biosynthesis